ncbi:hypothetical protein ACFL2H_10165 [Planctomycetota bacterium]
MAEHYRVSIPQPPFSFLIRRMFGEEAFVRDVQRLSAISDTQRAQIAESLGERTFADMSALLYAVSVAGVSEADDVADTLHRLSLMSRQSDTKKESAYNAFSIAIASSSIEKEKHDPIRQAFKELCLDPRSLDLQQKAERLATATGCSIDDFGIVCDIRPVFNVEGDEIVGALPYYTLRVEYDDGETQKIDLHLSNENLDRLKKVVDRAVNKRDVLKDAITAMSGWSEPEIQ